MFNKDHNKTIHLSSISGNTRQKQEIDKLNITDISNTYNAS